LLHIIPLQVVAQDLRPGNLTAEQGIEHPTGEGSALKGKSVLVVDDEQAVREVLREYLMQEGYDVETAKNGADALDIIESGGQNFDCVIADVRMPHMDGLTLLRGLKAINPSTPVIMLTAYASIDSAVEALRIGAFNFIQKPVVLDHLSKVLRDAVAAQGRAERRRAALPNLQYKLSYHGRCSPTHIESIVDRIYELATSIECLDESEEMGFRSAIQSALFNAVIHGNKNDMSKSLQVDGTFSIDKCAVAIEDEGEGFDHKTLLARSDNPAPDTQRDGGLDRILGFMDEVSFNDTGNRITMVKKRQ
jgi:CheY-like chemotaxis protein/anti-sigma regulatory factor (Ser/Thr protein kinase)